MKKTLSIILALVLCLSVFSITASAYTYAGGVGNLTWYYNASTKTLTVNGNGKMPKIKNATATTWYGEKYKSQIKNLVIGEGVTSIASYAFENLSSLTSVSIPDNVLTVAEGAFAGCSSLQAVKLSSKMTVIPTKMFYGCYSIQELTIQSGVTKIGKYSLAGCFTKLEIPSGVTEICEAAFYGCPLLSEITIPESVVTIGINAFAYCPYLTDITAEGMECNLTENALGMTLISVTVPPEDYFDAFEELNSAVESQESSEETAKITILNEATVNTDLTVTLFKNSSYEAFCTENNISFKYFCEHSYGDWFVYKEPTLFLRGIKRHICSKCGETEDGFIPTTECNVLIDRITGIEARWSTESEITTDNLTLTASIDNENKSVFSNYFDSFFAVNISVDLVADASAESDEATPLPDDLVIMIPYEKYVGSVEKVYKFNEAESKLIKISGFETDDGYIIIPYKEAVEYVIVGTATLNENAEPEFYMFSYEALFTAIIKIVKILLDILVTVV